MSGTVWTTEPDAELPVNVGASGFAARAPETLLQVLNKTVEKHGGKVAMAVKRNNVWQEWTWKDYYNDCRLFSKSLIHLKCDKFTIVNILGFNSPEWIISNVGATMASCISAGIYATNTPEACAYITNHSKAGVLVAEDNKQLEKYTKVDCPPSLKAIVLWNEKPSEENMKKISVPCYTFQEFLALGKDIADTEVDSRASTIKPGNCASLIYTSGTTGPPKAVMISHDNITWTAANICDHYCDLNHTDRVVSYLPLSHIAAQLVDIYAMIQLGASTHFCQPDALKGSLTTTMKEVRPTFFFAVPRVWEKIQEKMVQIGRDNSALKKRIGAWAKGLGTEKSKLAQFGAGGGAPFGYGCAKKIVLSKIKEALGLDQTKGCFTAAAPIAPETLWYFASLDIPIYEVFGQSECTGPHSCQDYKGWKVGTCGRPLMGTTTKLDANTGELCYSGRHIFMGYMYMPDKTAETIDSEGFLHSGDVAVLDKDNDPNVPAPSGFLSITGRIKELIITAGGENVPPVLIENEMKAAMNAISNVMVIGDKRKFLSMVVSLKCEVDLDTGVPKDDLAKDSLFAGEAIGSTAKTYTEAKACEKWKKYIDDGMKVANKKTTSSAQIVQKWVWLPVDFSEKAGDLTPTLKLKRNVVNEKYQELIDSIYA